MLSFIVPAHDEAALLGATLDALLEAARTLRLAHELIVVDDASGDATADIARGRGARVLRIEARHIAAARNAGAENARGARQFDVDADTRIDAVALSAAMAALDAGAIGGGAAVRLLGDSVRWHERLFTRLLMVAFRWTRIASGCFLFCSRDAFAAVGGFDLRWYAGEDVAMSRALAAHGRFVILRASVLTSDRKLRTFSLVDHLRLALQFVLRGPRILRSRHALGLWYARRR
jgi:glycosyltransferase involved in cell wall biosynthesis